jgi:photosystem II stability/assembly factor-like uncharacterized protein
MKLKIYLMILVSMVISITLWSDWNPVGPISNNGCILESIKQDPENNQILYAASTSEGIFKSTNNGTSWFCLTNEFADIPFKTVCVNHLNPEIIYAGTGTGAIFKSMNAGIDWIQVFQHEFNRNINEIVISPDDGSRIYAAIETTYSLEGGGIIKSINSGEDWEIITGDLNSKNFHALAIDYDNSNIIYAGSKFLYSCDGGFFKSEDGGLSWSQSSSESVTEIAIDLLDNSTVLMGTDSNGTFRSTDSGETWQQSSSDNVEFFQGEQFSITYDPINTDIVYSGMNPPNNYAPTLYKSIDNGISWNSVTEDLNTPIVFSICVNSVNSNVLHAATFNGHYISSNAGLNWSPANHGLAFVKVYNIVINPNEVNTWSIFSNKGLYVTTTAGEEWTRSVYTVIPSLYHPEDNTLWGYVGGGSYSDGIYISYDNGLNWGVLEWIIHTNHVALNPINPNIVLVPTDETIWKSENGGYDWSNADNGITEFPVYAVYFDLINPNIVYSISESNVWKSDDTGDTWINIDGPFDSDENQPKELIFDPTNTSVIYIRANSHLWKSNNYGQDWSELILPSTEFSAFCIDGMNTNILFTGFNGSGVYLSYDEGQNWESFNDSLSNLQINSFALDPDNYSFILTGTDGDGVFYSEYEPENHSINKIPFVNENKLTIYPNPFNPSTTLSFYLKKDCDVEITIYSIKGKKIKSLLQSQLPKGEHSVIWNGEDDFNKIVPSGIYLSKMKIQNKVSSIKKCILLK